MHFSPLFLKKFHFELCYQHKRGHDWLIILIGKTILSAIYIAGTIFTIALFMDRRKFDLTATRLNNYSNQHKKYSQTVSRPIPDVPSYSPIFASLLNEEN